MLKRGPISRERTTERGLRTSRLILVLEVRAPTIRGSFHTQQGGPPSIRSLRQRHGLKILRVHGYISEYHCAAIGNSIPPESDPGNI